MGYGPTDLMNELIALIGKRGADVHDVERLGDLLGACHVARRVHFYHEIKRLIRLSPLGVFRNEEQRLNLLGACQSALDKVVDEVDDQ